MKQKQQNQTLDQKILFIRAGIKRNNEMILYHQYEIREQEAEEKRLIAMRNNLNSLAGIAEEREEIPEDLEGIYPGRGWEEWEG
jgi:hypothetical protein